MKRNLKAEDLAAQNDYLSNKSQQQTQMQDIQEMQEVANEIRAVQEQYGIDDQDFS